MLKFINIYACLLCVLSCAPVLAQQQAGAVVQEIHRRNNPNHPGYPGYSVPTQPREVWQSKYGAIAADFEGGYAGIAEDENSLRAAKRVALRRCGSRSCKIHATIGNGCIAAVHGGGWTALGIGETAELALQNAKNKCTYSGGCEQTYLHCNEPVRIR